MDRFLNNGQLERYKRPQNSVNHNESTPLTPSPILTLEPLIEAVRHAVEGAGWELSGLQKTTSHQFEGRWEGDSTRSAYLFFHTPKGPDWVSVDVYLDETSRGLAGNLALVADLRPLGGLEPAAALLQHLSHLFGARADASYRRPVTLRFRMADADDDVAEAETEVRFKVRIPRATIGAGSEAVREMVGEAMGSFTAVLDTSSLRVRAVEDEEG